MSKRFWIFAALCVLVGMICVALFFGENLKKLFISGQNIDPAVPVSGVPLVLPEQEKAGEDQKPDGERDHETVSEESSKTAVTKRYISPINFTALQKKNPDIYAWLSIEGTDISYPLVQNADDSFYLDHDENRESNSEGAIFSESAYNGKTFEDAITVLYGHHMKSGKMFGNLQQMYSDPEQFEKCRDICVYTPEKELHYQVFAALPYDSRHIMYCYGNEAERGVLGFLYSLTSTRSIDAIIDRENPASSEDKLLVLSTCLKGDRSKRFIVVAKAVLSE